SWLCMESSVTHLNLEAFLDSLADEFRPLCPFANPRSGGSQDSFPLGGALRCGVAGSAFRLSPTADLHGVRPTDLAGGLAGYCRLSECETARSLPLGLSRADRQIHLGRRERATGLAALGGLSQKPHWQSTPALCRGRHWSRHR